MTPKISILLPVRNGAVYLDSCISSVLDQTEKNFELLISDDGSKDKSVEIIKSFSDPRIQFFQGPQKGLFENLNFLLSKSKAPVLRVFCQDDRMHAECIERELDFHSRHSFVGISFSKANRMDGEGKILSTPNLADLPEILSPDLSAQHFFYHGCIAGNLSTVVWKRELVQKYGVFDCSYEVSGDYEYWARLCENEYLGIIQEPLLDLRAHEGQLSRSRKSFSQFVVENRRIRQLVLPRLPVAVRKKARLYESQRHDVMDFHALLRSTLDPRMGSALDIAKTFSLPQIAEAIFHWLWTGNNRLYRPQAPWILTCSWSPQLSTRASSKRVA